jgi:bifunctional non-homologous end joining protein LigD
MLTQSSRPSKAFRAVEKQLERYRSMRDFRATSEPRGDVEGRAPSDNAESLPFVIQKHAATRLHYDFRLGWRGVLKSWAVTKGPSLYPGDKRLAVQVEDHPIEYGGFEGTIPKGQYGGGTVMVWDFGDWEPEGDVDRGLREGHLKFVLHGQKLHGKWALVRMHGRAEREDKPNWLLIKEKDSYARPVEAEPITDEEAASAITHRSIDEIAKSEDHVWDSSSADRNNSPKASEARRDSEEAAVKPGKMLRTLRDSPLRSAHREAFPKFIVPQLAQQAAVAPNGAEWIHELKLDGYRIQIHVRSTRRQKPRGRETKLLTRNGLDWTARMPDIANAAAKLNVDAAILDGEVVALDKNGGTSFADLQAAFQEGKQKYLTYFAFDLLHLDGRNVRDLPLSQRKKLLTELLSNINGKVPLLLSEHFHSSGEEVFRKACSLGAEGVVSKLETAKYRSGRGSTWLKVKCIQEQEFVIGGFTLPSNGGAGVGALLLGYYEAGKLHYAGRTGTGFTQKTQRTLHARLNRILRKRQEFVDMPASASRGVHWVRPELVAQVSFANWTRDNLVRQAAFKGLREDKKAIEVERETAVALDKRPRAASKQDNKSGHAQSKSSGRSNSKMSKLHLTHPDKVLDEESGVTKQLLAEYYLAVVERMLPHIEDRPLSVLRCPEGSGKPCFYQKHVGPGLPEGVEGISIPNRKTGKKEEFLTLNTVEGLVGMAQMGVLEIHPWGSRNESLEKPDRVIFDLDPDAEIDWDQLTACATDLRERLKKLGLVCFVKTTGGKGLHVVAPIDPEHDWAAVKQFAHRIVLEMEKANPALYITNMSKAARKNRIYLDYLRNDRESTAVAPWSPRARSGTPVAMPIEWKELKATSAPAFHVSDIAEWQKRLKSDPWKEMTRNRQRLPVGSISSVSNR